ncbi:MAG: zinc metalloprotease HtpX [Rhodocyclaceae bacterium]|nr:zinc metalloprotease HtpX [Rhodocyclaceae bacterium]
MTQALASRHAATNRLQTALLIIVLLAIGSTAGALLFGETGFWVALGASLLALLIEPAAAGRLTLALYRAEPLPYAAAPELWQLTERLARRANLERPPTLHYVPSGLVNAFAVGSRQNSAIALTDGLLRTLSRRELAGVLAHEIAHIAHGDLRVMGLADYVSRLTALLATLGQLILLIALPAWLVGAVEINWLGLLFLAFAPQLALLAQLGLSRVREFDADRAAAELTGDPAGLAMALAKIERLVRGWRHWLFPGWGNPEPSWLRTHPATEDRIARLMELAQSAPPDYPSLPFAKLSLPAAAAPRWRIGGLWR